MNKEEMLAMEAGKELNELIAKTLFSGHILNKASRLSDRTLYALVGGENEGYQPLDKIRTLATVRWRHTETEAWEACPNYSTDMSAAWEVVEKMRERFDWVGIDTVQKSKYRCLIIDRIILVGRETSGECFADTAPEAICKAALIAVMDS